ncbi:MAG: hypothetical protein Q9M13_01735 [Mariprofundales bacterium]|nr:hypothetical protein [Mariprofundales bacterium]
MILLLITTALSACATKPIVMINAFGDSDTCIAESIMDKIVPHKVHDECKAALTKIGYLPADEAGTIDFAPEKRGGDIVVTTLPDEALQQQPELHSGDNLLSIDGVRPDSVKSAQSMLFGPVGSSIAIILGRESMEFPLQLIRTPIDKGPPEVIPLTDDSYSSRESHAQNESPTQNKLHTQNREQKSAHEPKESPPFSILSRLKRLFSPSPAPSPSPAQRATTVTGSTAEIDQSPVDIYSSPPSPARPHHDDTTADRITDNKLTENRVTADNYATAPNPPPLIIIGDQVCRERQHFLDVGSVTDRRGQQLLVTIDHIQLINAPYTEFHHFKREQIWSNINSWQPCYGDSPLFIYPQQ